VMPALSISAADLASLVDELLAGGTAVIAPARDARGRIDYRAVGASTQVVLDGPLPSRSLKGHVLPASEPLFSWRQRRGSVEIDEVPTSFGPRIVIGARPCDAAALEIVDRVMGWDTRDELWFGRREATTVVGLACQGEDASCFCTAVGLGPAATRGSDLMLHPSRGGYAVEVVTEKGRALVDAHAGRFQPAGEPLVPPPVEPQAAAAGIDAGAVRDWVERHFDHPLWHEIALRCHGCGACASVCPTCHCFDVVDEPEGIAHGTRRRNWDTCQASRFTVHASGHNPRPAQGARFRQRVAHKFAIYPARFGDVLCTGCGRCARACPAGQDIAEILGRITALAGEESGRGVAV
jgi:ferredoxin